MSRRRLSDFVDDGEKYNSKLHEILSLLEEVTEILSQKRLAPHDAPTTIVKGRFAKRINLEFSEVYKKHMPEMESELRVRVEVMRDSLRQEFKLLQARLLGDAPAEETAPSHRVFQGNMEITKRLVSSEIANSEQSPH